MRTDRAIWISLAVLGLVAAAVMLRENGPAGMAWLFPECPFHRLTGLHCPGCGMTRAAHAALNGRIGAAFHFNPLGMILLPAASVALGLEVVGWIRGKPLPLRVTVSSRVAWGIVWAVLAFWILRNLPVWPFTLLAPP